MIFLVYCIASLFYCVFFVVSSPYVLYHPTVMARCSLFVLKVPLNHKRTNKQTNDLKSSEIDGISTAEPVQDFRYDDFDFVHCKRLSDAVPKPRRQRHATKYIELYRNNHHRHLSQCNNARGFP